MKKVMGILSIATKVVAFVVVCVIGLISLATAYIMFAPDDMPKPFRLMYDYTTPEPTLVAEVTAEPTPEAHVYLPGEGVMVNMSTKIINLKDPAGRKYIRLTMVLEFIPPEEDHTTPVKKSSGGHGASDTGSTENGLETKINARMPVLDDIVITHLSTKTYDELYTAEGKEQLRQELMAAIANRLPDYPLLSVYFTEFVVQ